MIIDDLINGIARKLNMIYGDEYRIYTEAVRQGLKEPCFFITALEVSRKIIRGQLYHQSVPVMVQYHPEKKQSRAEIQTVGNELLEHLEVIEAMNGELIRGRNLSFQIVDERLHLKVEYDIHLLRVEEKTEMETLSAKESVKG